eukprot:2762054-Rhodomonas_salina.4
MLGQYRTSHSESVGSYARSVPDIALRECREIGVPAASRCAYTLLRGATHCTIRAYASSVPHALRPYVEARHHTRAQYRIRWAPYAGWVLGYA